MGKYKTASIYALILLLCGCSVTGPLRRHGYNAQVIHTPKPIHTEPKKDSVPQYFKFEHTDGRPTEYYVPTTTLENGEQVMSLQLEEVVVVAKSRTLPERLGKVTIDFVITLPRNLQGTCRSIVVAPVLHNQGKDTPLQELTIRGAFFSKVQEREYWQYDRYVDVYDPDSLQAMQAFERFVRFPYPEGVRLDSVLVHATDISYYYTQDVATTDAGKRLNITLEGKVEGLDGSSYNLPPSDTLQYNISSMLTFADTATRYVKHIIEKYAEVKDRNYLSFRVGKHEIIDSLGNNAQQLQRIEGLMEELVNQKEFYIDSIILSSSASPEGSAVMNQILATARAKALRNRLSDRFPDAGLDTLITMRPVGEDWIELVRLIQNNPKIMCWEQIIDLVKTVRDPDKRENMIRQKYPYDYTYIRETIYPTLRSVNFKYDLRRVGMIKDTIHTTVVDTTYMRGRQLLDDRRYAEALTILRPYDDRNTAIALLSLGYDDHAYQILCKEPDSAIRQYLQAIACARLGRKQDAIKHYQEAVKEEPNMEYRAKLDPELSKLIKP